MEQTMTMIDNVNRGKVDFWGLSHKEQSAVVRYRSTHSKYIVFDYARSKDEKNSPSFGIIYKLGEFIDKDFTHGFVIDKSTCGGVLCDRWEEISVYCKVYPMDEGFENRTNHPYHIFSDVSKAIEYSLACRKYANRNGMANTSLYDVLGVVRKYDKTFSIMTGKRNIESGTEYEAIANGTTTIFRVSDNGTILMLRGQMFTSFECPHLDLFDEALKYFYGKGKYIPSEDMIYTMGEWCIHF